MDEHSEVLEPYAGEERVARAAAMENAVLGERVAFSAARLAELEARLNQNSRVRPEREGDSGVGG